MKQRDEGWDRLGRAIRQALDENTKHRAIDPDCGRPASAAELATLLSTHGVTAEDVRNWIRGRANPHMHLIPLIAETLAGDDHDDPTWDPLRLPRAMGVVPSTAANVPELVFSISKLQARLTKLQQQMNNYGQSVGAAGLVRKACLLADISADKDQEARGWAIAIWPAIEGPADCRIHVADRIDFRRTDGSWVAADDVRAEFKEELTGLGAVEGSSFPRWADREDVSVSRWAIPHLGGPRSSTIVAPWPGLAAVGVVSTTVRSWATDVGSHLADALGYGQTSSRDLSDTLYEFRLGEVAEGERDTLHRWLVRAPQLKRVWSHWSAIEDPLDAHDGLGNLVMIALIEDDSLLGLQSRSGKERRTLDDLQSARDQLLESAQGRPKTVVLDVSFPPGGAADPDSRNGRFAQALECTALALTAFFDNGWLNPGDITAYWRADRQADYRTQKVRAWLGRRLSA